MVVDDLTQLVDAAQALRLVRLPANAASGRRRRDRPGRPRACCSPTSSAFRACSMPELPQVSIDRLGELLPPITFQRNPVDTGRPAETFGAVLETVGSARRDRPAGRLPARRARRRRPGRAARRPTRSPAVLSLTAAATASRAHATQLAHAGVPVLPTPERCARAVAAVVRDAVQRARRAAPDAAGAAGARRSGRAAPGTRTRRRTLVAELGIAYARRGSSARPTTRPARRSRSSGAPVVVKVLHPAIEHKTDAGGVHLGITDDESLGRALEAIDRIAGARYLIEETAPAGPGADPRCPPRSGVRPARRARLGRHGGRGRRRRLRAPRARRRRSTPPRCSTSSRPPPPSAAPAARRPSTRTSSPAAIVAFGALIAGRDDIAEIEVNPLRVTRGRARRSRRTGRAPVSERTIVVGAGPGRAHRRAGASLRGTSRSRSSRRARADRIRPGSRAIFIHGASMQLLEEIRPGPRARARRPRADLADEANALPRAASSTRRPIRRLPAGRASRPRRACRRS